MKIRQTSVVRRTAGHALRWLGPAKKRLLISPLLAGLLTIAETSVLVIAARLLLAFVDQETTVDIGVSEVAFLTACVVGLLLAAVTASLRFIDSRFTASLSEIAVRNARRTILESAFHTPWQSQRSQRLGELQRLLATNGTASSVPVVVIATMLTAGLTVSVYLVIILVTSPQLLVIVVFLVIGLVSAFAPLRRLMKRRAREHTKAIAELQLDATSASALQRELEIYAAQDEALESLVQVSDRLAGVHRQQRFLQRFVSPLYQLSLMTSIIIAVGFARVADLTVAGVGTAALLLLRSLSYVQQLNGNVQTAIEALPLLDEIEQFVAENQASKRRFGDRSLARVETVELHDVSYRYNGSGVALEGVNLTLRAGDRVGVVGPSGGGKSTLANILVRLTEPSGGEVRVNDVDIDEFASRPWADAIGFVGQEPLLLRGTIADNVRLYRDATSAEIAEALEKANLLRDVQDFPDGLDTMVGEGWSSLSGGQRQRLGIARALLRNPTLLVLDEPSSALDGRSEGQIEAALANLDPDAIVVIISHRPLLLQACTRVLRVEDGIVGEELSELPPVDAG